MKSHVRLPGLNNGLVRELDRGRVRELLVAVALAAVMLLPLLAYVWQNVEWVRKGYRIERLKNQRERLVEVQHRLRLEKASLESLTRVERVAVTQLGLREPPGGTVVLVDEKALDPRRRQNGARLAMRSPGEGRGGDRDAAGRNAN